VHGALHDVREERQAAEQRGTEHDTGEDFADDLGLAEKDEDVAEKLRTAGEEQKGEEEGSELGVGHGSVSGRFGCGWRLSSLIQQAARVSLFLAVVVNEEVGELLF
jgi:hypothetical protein